MTQIVPTKSGPSKAAIEHAHERHVFESMIFELDKVTFIIAWIHMLLMRGVCIVYCIGVVFALLFLNKPIMSYFADLLGPGVKSILQPAAATYMVIAGAHTVQIIRMIVASIHRNRLSWGGETNLTRPPSSKNLLIIFAARVWRELFARDGFFGIESPYYEWRYATREIVQILSQSTQALNSSALIGRMWINHLYVAIVVTNCISTPLIQRIGKHLKWSVALERVTRVGVDILLNAGTAMVLPFALLLPYANALEWKFGTFDVQHWYNDVWFTNLVYENRQIFPLSAFDFGFKIVAHLSIYLSLSSIKATLRLRGHATNQATIRGPSSCILRKQTKSRRQISSLRKWYCRPIPPRLSAILHTCFVLWAIIIFSCHIVAVFMNHRNNCHQMDGCKQQLRPWLVTKSACSVYEYSCSSRGVELMEVGSLDFLDENSLAVLIIAHCPALRVSSSIQDFPHLLGIEIYNSTLVEWNEAAAITAKTHPDITFAFIIRTNLTEIPPGLLDSNLPPTLLDIEISHTNLTNVPDDLDVKWRYVVTLYIEYSMLTTIPDSLLRMRLSDFSVIGNNIAHLPDFSISPDTYFMLALAKNPITTLPSSLGDLKNIQFMNLAGTNLSTLPDWMDTFMVTQVFLTGTPLCNKKNGSEIESNFGFNSRLSCTYTDFRMQSRYPLEVTTPLLAS